MYRMLLNFNCLTALSPVVQGGWAIKKGDLEKKKKEPAYCGRYEKKKVCNMGNESSSIIYLK